MSETHRMSGRGGDDLVGGRVLARNTALNMLGQGAPMVAAVVAIPLLIAALGTDRFAILAVAWTVIGYFSLFDLGISRALTQAVADGLAAGARARLPALIWTSLTLMAALGVVGGALLALGAPWVVRSALNIPTELQRESLHALYLLAFGLPWVIGMNGLRGVLEAYQRFDLLTVVRIPMGVLTYLGPLLVTPFSSRLGAVVSVLVGLRIVALVVHWRLCLRAVPELRGRMVLAPALAAPLARTGGWMTVSNVISPLLVYADRFVIGAIFPVAAVAYYVTPYEAVTKLLLIPGALAAVFFPALTASFATDRRRATEIFLWGTRVVFLLLLPAVLLVNTFATEALTLWLGPVFAAESAGVLRWLAVGVFVNSLGQVAYAAVQGGGRADATAKLHLLEVPLYVAALWWLVTHYGVAGAAAAWTLRVSVDALALFAVAGRMLSAEAVLLRRLGPMTVFALALLGVSTLVTGTGAKGLFYAASVTATVAGGWLWVLGASDRKRLLAILRRRTAHAT